MGYVQEELAEVGQEVHGAIIALEDDLKIRRALKVTRNIEFFRYIINFRLQRLDS
jgi:restriction system protein